MRQVLRELRAQQRSERAAQLNSVDPDEPFGERPLLPMDSIAFERRSFKNGQDEPTKNETAGVRHDALDPADRYERESSNEKLAIVWLTIFEHLPGCFLEGWEQARGTDNGDDDGPAKPQKIFGTSTQLYEWLQVAGRLRDRSYMEMPFRMHGAANLELLRNGVSWWIIGRSLGFFSAHNRSWLVQALRENESYLTEQRQSDLGNWFGQLMVDPVVDLATTIRREENRGSQTAAAPSWVPAASVLVGVFADYDRKFGERYSKAA